MIKIDEDIDIEQVISENKKVIFEFTAPWCTSCKIMETLMKRFGENNSGIPIYLIDIDEYPECASSYEITSLPTVLSFNNGAEVNRIIGVPTKDFDKRIMEKIL